MECHLIHIIMSYYVNMSYYVYAKLFGPVPFPLRNAASGFSGATVDHFFLCDM